MLSLQFNMTGFPAMQKAARTILENHRAMWAAAALSRGVLLLPLSAADFCPEIRPDELDSLEITVDVLGETEKIDSPDQLDVKRYGVIVSKGFRRGLLLPNLDGVDTVEEQISIALQKAGLKVNEKNYQLERFEVVRHF